MPFNSLSVKPIDQQDGTLVVNPVQQYSGVQNLNVAQYSNPINQPGIQLNVADIPQTPNVAVQAENAWTPPQPNQTLMGATGSALNDNFIQPFVNTVKETGNITGGIGQAVLGSLLDKTAQQKALTKQSSLNQFADSYAGRILGAQQDTQGNYHLTKDINPTTSRQLLGGITENTLNLASVVPAAGWGDAAAQGTMRFLPALGKAALEGGGYGLGYGAAQTAQMDNPTWQDYASNMALNAGAGAATAGVIHTGVAGLEVAARPVIAALAQGGEAAAQAMVRLASDPEMMGFLHNYAPQLVAAIANGDHAQTAYVAGSMLFKGTKGFDEREAAGMKPEQAVTGEDFYKVSDKNATIKPALFEESGRMLDGQQPRKLTVDDILNHSDLKGANADLFKIPVVLDNTLKPGLDGMHTYQDGKSALVFNPEDVYLAKQEGPNSYRWQELRKTILHELTHAEEYRAGTGSTAPQHHVGYDETDWETYRHSPLEVNARTVENSADMDQKALDKSSFYKKAGVNMDDVHAQKDIMNEAWDKAVNDPGSENSYRIKDPGKRSTDQILKERKDAAEQLTERDLRSKARNLQRKVVEATLESQPELYSYDRAKAKLEGRRESFASRKVIPASESLVHNSDLLNRSGDAANKFMRDNGLNAVVEGTARAGLKPETLGQYAIDKHHLELADEGRKVSSRDLRESKQVVNDLAPQYDKFSQGLTNYSQKLVDLLHESGLINDGAHAYLKSNYKAYVPLQRLFSPEEMEAMRSGNGAGATITKQTVVRRLEGSSREIKNPIESLIQMTNAATKQVEKNRGANIIYKDALTHGDKLGLTVLRNAEDQRHLTEIYKESSELRAQRDKNQKTISRQSAQARKLATEINNLERKGLLVRLKEGSNEVAGKGEAFRYETREALHSAKRMVPKGTDSFHVVGAAREISGEMKTHLTIKGEPTAADTRAMVEGLINSDPSTLRRIRNMQALRQGKHEAIMSKVDELKAETDQIKADLKDRYSEASLLRQANQKGKSIITGYDKGTKFVVEVPRALRQSLDNQSRQPTSDLIKILAPTARVGRMGATALNLGFSLVANVVKDPGSGFINGAHGMRMFDPRTWAQAFGATVKPDGPLAQRLRLNEMYLKTYYDSGRQETKMTVDEMASHASPAARAKFLATHPEKSIGATEDLMSFGERFNRNWQALSYLYGGKGLGKSGDELVAYMQKGAWKNTTDFSRGGNVTRELNMIDQFLNAAAQGTRTFQAAVRDRPVQTLTKVGMIAGVIPALLTVNNMQPENKEVYGYIPEYEKQSNLIFVLPGASRDPQTGKLNGVIKIPMANEIARLADITRMGVEAHINQGTIDAKKLMADLVQSGTGMNVDSPMAAIGNFTPQIVKDIGEPLMNKSMFTGQQIVPDYMKDLPADQQVYKTTSGSARAIGGALGISPLIVQNFIGSQFGTVGKEIEGLVDKGLAAHGDIPQEQATSKTIVDDIVSRVYGSTGPSDKALVAQAMTNGLNAITNPQDKQFAKAMLAKNDDKNFLDSTDRNGMLLNSFMGNKQLYNFFKGLNDANISVGKPADPFYQLSPDQQAKVLFYRSQGVARDAGQDYTKNGESLYKSLGLSDQWYQDYSKQNDNFFKQLDAQNTANGVTTTSAPRSLDGSVRPKATDEQQSLMDAYNALPQHDGPKGGSKTRSLWIQSHPDEWAKIQDFYAGQDAFTNNERGKLGLDTVDYTSGSGGSSGGSSGSGTYRVGSSYGGSKKYSDYVGGGGYSDYKGTNGYRESRTAGKMTISSGVKMPGGGTISVNDHEPAWKSKKPTIRITKGIPKKSKIA